ncbi:MAG: NADH-quinone oxidoreductase subunit A [Alphaproteobacteria bacterium]|nr:NADH-quinone oxidoreductase subunit A [Alphaproteobacteria bacterium]
MVLAVIAVSVLTGKNRVRKKYSARENGFKILDNVYSRLDLRFYMGAMVFVVFSVAVIFLFPWATSLDTIGFFGFWSMIVFLFIMSIGFIYGLRKGAWQW